MAYRAPHLTRVLKLIHSDSRTKSDQQVSAHTGKAPDHDKRLDLGRSGLSLPRLCAGAIHMLAGRRDFIQGDQLMEAYRFHSR